MKFEKTLFRVAVMAWFLLFASGAECRAHGEMTPADRAHIDSTISVGFITCGPGTEAYSLYGHTALHLTDLGQHVDVAVNWGIFDFDKPNFVGRFVFGLTDYTMGIYAFDDFLREYRANGRWVKEQRLNLTAEEKVRIAEAIWENYRPERREYRYNFFYDNCTTRARDMIAGHLDAETKWQPSANDGLTFRQLVHQYCAEQPWTRFGNDMLLGLQADRPTTTGERQFLPSETMSDLGRLRKADGTPLVSATETLVNAPAPPADGGFPLSPRACALLLLAVVTALTAWEIKTRQDLRWLDVLLMLPCGLAGIVLTLMLFSEHPTVRLNLQLLLLNPLPLFFIWPMLKGRCRWQYRMWIVLICLFFIGAIWQTYAEGMMIVASSLLIRNIKRLRSEK